MKKEMSMFLIFFLILIPNAFAYTQENEIIETNIEVNIDWGGCYWINQTCSWINLTIETEDDDYYYYNISNLTSQQDIEIDMVRDIECKGEDNCEDLSNLSTTMLSVCEKMTMDYDAMYSANFDCSKDLIVCRNEVNDSQAWKTKYTECNNKTCPECKKCMESGLIFVLIAIAFGAGIMIQKNKGVVKRDIDKSRPEIRRDDSVLDVDEAKRKGKEIMENLKKKMKGGP